MVHTADLWWSRNNNYDQPNKETYKVSVTVFDDNRPGYSSSNPDSADDGNSGGQVVVVVENNIGDDEFRAVKWGSDGHPVHRMQCSEDGVKIAIILYPDSPRPQYGKK